MFHYKIPVKNEAYVKMPIEIDDDRSFICSKKLTTSKQE